MDILDWRAMVDALPPLLGALPETLWIAAQTFVAAMALGAVLAWARLSRIRAARVVSATYIEIVRGVPPLLMLLLVYYGAPFVFTAIGIDSTDWPPETFAVIAFALSIAAYSAELMRSSLLAVDRGQREALRVSGVPEPVGFVRVIVPQAFALAIPNLENTVISLFKYATLVFAIGGMDLFARAQQLSSMSYGAHQTEVFVVLALIYWTLSLLVTAAARLVAARLDFIG